MKRHEKRPGESGPRRRRVRAAAVTARAAAACALANALLLGGCATYAGYEGPRPTGGVATIHADPRINAGLPMAISIRRIDGREVGLQYSKVEVAPGEHRLLVDCTMAASRTTSRHELQIDVDPGGHYRLVAESAPGNQRCGEVRLEAR
jgi:hypothetical protein